MNRLAGVITVVGIAKGWSISWLRSAELCGADKSIYSRWGFAPKSFILASAKFLSVQKFDVISVECGPEVTPNGCFRNGKSLKGDHVEP